MSAPLVHFLGKAASPPPSSRLSNRLEVGGERTGFDGRHLQNTEQVIPEAKAVGESFEREGVLGNARVARQILHRAEARHEMIVMEGMAAPID